MKDTELILRESFEGAFRRWWVIVLLTVLGGLAGWTIHFFRPPVYEAAAFLTVNMDFQKVKLTQIEEDFVFNSSEAIASSVDVMNQVVMQAQADGTPMDFNQLLESISLERKQSVWEFHIRNRDPETAAKLANIWTEKAFQALTAALEHAVRADQIQDQIKSISLYQFTSGSPELSPDLQTTLSNLSTELLQEKQLSQGVISVMKYSLTGPATIPTQPVLYNLANLVLAGATIGFVISLWVVSQRKVMSSD
jgi:uncharacterized protein involved in exopolysaccharide biosynthesis